MGSMCVSLSSVKLVSSLLLGPLALVMAHAHTHRASYRYPLQLLLSAAQLLLVCVSLCAPMQSKLAFDATFTNDNVCMHAWMDVCIDVVELGHVECFVDCCCVLMWCGVMYVDSCRNCFWWV